MAKSASPRHSDSAKTFSAPKVPEVMKKANFRQTLVHAQALRDTPRTPTSGGFRPDNRFHPPMCFRLASVFQVLRPGDGGLIAVQRLSSALLERVHCLRLFLGECRRMCPCPVF